MRASNDDTAIGNRLYFGDNLEILRGDSIPDRTVDLIYLDPPFNSQAQYNVLFQKPREDDLSAQAGAFLDTWRWGHEAELSYDEIMRAGGGTAKFIDALKSALGESDMMAYLVMMAVRLDILRAKLKSTGSLYLHCDPAASHYLKVILDGIFGHNNFRNEIVWKRTFAHGGASRWGDIHDTILFYTASETYTWNRSVQQKLEDTYVDTKYRFSDERGRYRLVVLTGPGTTGGESGKPWRSYNPTAAGRHWAVPKRAIEALRADGIEIPDGLHDQLELLYQHGFIRFPQKSDGSQGVPEFKLHLATGQPIQDIIADIPPLNSQASERRGYPTQKPVALLDRIIRASSNEGDTVFDPFCGCGTTIDAAQRAGRDWIGVDIAIHAIKVIEARLAEQFPGVRYKVEGMPRDFASAIRLAEEDKYQFQWWANYLFNPHALREQKKGMDRGVDGDVFFPNGPGRPWGRMLTSVKGGENVGPTMVRDFARVIDREKAEMGLFICLYKPTREMTREAASAGLAKTVHGDIPKLQIVAMEDWFQGRLPKLPPLEHLPSAAFSTARRRVAAQRMADPSQPELPLSFTGGRAKGRSGTAGFVHFNPNMVRTTA